MGLPLCREEDAAARFMFLFLDIFMAKMYRFNELQAVIAGKTLIPGNLRTEYLECYTYGRFSSDRGCKILELLDLRDISASEWFASVWTRSGWKTLPERRWLDFGRFFNYTGGVKQICG
jgi:hypothetical protein